MGGFLSHLKPEINSEILEATCGPIQGNLYKHNNKIVDGYLGIPFAKTLKRFEKPVEAETWTEVKNCTKYGPGCPQGGVFEQSNGFPVMFNIYGGGFEMGTSAAYDDYSISGILPLKDVIVVTANYRVGVLGFFTTGDEKCRGNLALWDLTLALKWVQKHIRSFGGDPNNVTVFGCSAGGVCADLLTLSSHSRDLFQKCIAMSGSADCEMACRSKANQALIFKEFAIENGCLQTDPSNLMNWYQEQNIELLNKLSAFKFSPSGFMSCGSNMDGDFFTESLDELSKSAPKKDFIFGRTEFEGLIMAIPDPTYSRVGDSIETSSKKLFKSDVVSNPEDVHKKLESWYSEGIDKSDVGAVRKRFIEFLGDAVFNVGILNSAQAASKSGNSVFLYSFDYCNPDGYGPLGNLLDFKASSHGNDFRYIFGSGGYDTFVPTEEDFQMMENMANWFSNFAKYGNPNGNDVAGKWENYTIELPGCYFKIDYPTSRMQDDILNERLKKLMSIEGKEILI
ncbi:hypothetical protein B9Z55_019897 [Caenorhabditis nigoni]|uniref:Carboxylic ester hydrolase n=1 Tax=Caenorhabditis nigoni TaxID=1611254 RepID=A0A2G5TKE7_9PELO|nr:hypothetical protein B9Z55_019897 [Caenorhabditis nigoni]